MYEPEENKMKHNKTKNSDKKVYSIGSSKISRVFTNLNNKKKESNFNIIDNNDIYRNQQTRQSKRSKRKSLKDKIKFTFKLEDYEDIINNDNYSVKTISKKIKKLGLFEDDKKLVKKKSNFLSPNNNINNDDIKSSKTLKKNLLNDNKTNIKKKFTKRRSGKIRNKLKIDNIGKNKNEKDNISIDYFAKEEKNENECKIL